jgi:transaldolase
MKLFLDTINVETIRQWLPTGLIDGITSNPSNMSKEGKDPLPAIKEICALMPKGDINIEVTEQEPEKVYRQAHAIAKLAPNVTVKIPCALIYYPIIKKLVSEGIKINVTLVFSLAQGHAMAKLGVRYISPFFARLEDDEAGIELLEQLVAMLETYESETQVLVASIRTVEHLSYAIAAGAHAATMPAEILERAAQHPLTSQGLAKFAADWDKLGIKQFP